MESRWRSKSIRVINAVMAANPDATLWQLRKLISDAYPFGERANHPYSIWCSVVKEVLNADGQVTKYREAMKAKTVIE